MDSVRGGGPVPVNIRPTHYVSRVIVYFSVILWVIVQVNVPQPKMSGGVSNVRTPGNVSLSV